ASDPNDGDRTFVVCVVQWLDYGGVRSVLPDARGESPADIEPAPQSVYAARRLAKRVTVRARKLADAGADLTPLVAALEQIEQTTDANAAWLRRQLDGLSNSDGAQR